MNRIKEFFSAPRLANETLALRASLLSFIVNLHLVIAVGVAIIYATVLREEMIFPLAALLSCVPALGVRWLIQRGQVSLGALSFVGLIALLMPVLAFVAGSSIGTSSVTAFQFLTIVMAGLLLGGRGALGFWIFTSAVNGLVLFAEANGWYPASFEHLLDEIWILQTITFAAAAALLGLANRLIREAFGRARYENEERRNAEASLQLAVDAARLGTWSVDLASGKTQFSGQSTVLYGASAPDLLTHAHPEDRAHVQQALAGLYAGQQERLAISHRIVLPEGGERWVDSWAQLSRDEDGKPARIAGVMMDITERKRAEIEREKLILELETKNAELERFTYTVSHDLKSPIITIGGFLGYLEQDAMAGNLARVKTDIARINDATNRMSLLLNELLELSRIGRLMNPPEVVSLGQVVRDAVALVEGRIAARSIQVDIAPNLPLVYGDRVRLLEAVENLVDNAAKFMGKQSAPRIEIGQRGVDAGGKPIFFVRDNGIGIEPKYHTNIFGLFNKLDARSEGTGIGLALVKRIIQVHGGNVWVESDGIDQGAMFCFTLPFAPNQGLEEDSRVE